MLRGEDVQRFSGGLAEPGFSEADRPLAPLTLRARGADAPGAVVVNTGRSALSKTPFSPRRARVSSLRFEWR